jgi:hypothetical protein
MKNYLIFILLLACIYSGCNRDDDKVIIEALGVDFAYRNGDILTEGDCIDPQRNYAVLVHATTGNFGTLRPKEFDVVVNDILYSLTFKGEGTKLIPVELKEGENFAKIAGTNHEARILKNLPFQFELVD